VSAALIVLFAGMLPEAFAARLRCHGKQATVVGTARADRLRGTSIRDVIVARAGDDRIDGRGGADLICGGRGNDGGTPGVDILVTHAALEGAISGANPSLSA
jgi:Ca2+-binding RTX toxin-like protein